MVQTEDQYVFIHFALLDYMESGETEVDANELRDYIRKHMQTEQKTGKHTFVFSSIKNIDIF